MERPSPKEFQDFVHNCHLILIGLECVLGDKMSDDLRRTLSEIREKTNEIDPLDKMVDFDEHVNMNDYFEALGIRETLKTICSQNSISENDALKYGHNHLL